MKTRNATLSLVIVGIFFLLFIFKRWQEPKAKELFNRNPSHLIYTKHARCRMSCREIDSAEIKEIMQKGIINLNKSHLRDQPCPTFALQGRTSMGESLRVVFAQCGDETKVVTCYNLEQDFACDCPGDENKTHR